MHQFRTRHRPFTLQVSRIWPGGKYEAHRISHVHTGFYVGALATAADETTPRTDETALLGSPEEVFFEGEDLTLSGLLFRPSSVGPHPAVVFIRGSGPSSRDSYWAKAFAEVFLRQNIAVLLPDKRGSDKSEGDWRNASFEDLAGDTIAAVAFLKAKSGIRTDAVGVAGLSQGGKIAPIAAARSDNIAFVINIVGAATSFVEQVSWEMFHTFREAGVHGAELQRALELQILAERYLQGEVDWARYEAALSRGLESAWRPVAEGFPQTEDAWQWTFFRGVGDYDPLPFWRAMKQPVLVIYGEEDRNAPAVRSAYRLLRVFLEEEHPDAAVHVIAGAGHALWNPETTGTHMPELHPELLETLNDWIDSRLK